jgi:hypothetical protein
MVHLRQIAFRLVIIIMAGYTALAQPGIPACWIEVNPCEIHPHFSRQHLENPHSHEYLYDLAKTNVVQVLPIILIPLSLLIEILSGTLLLPIAANSLESQLKWISLLKPPPPRVLPFS